MQMAMQSWKMDLVWLMLTYSIFQRKPNLYLIRSTPVLVKYQGLDEEDKTCRYQRYQ